MNISTLDLISVGTDWNEVPNGYESFFFLLGRQRVIIYKDKVLHKMYPKGR